MKSNSSKRRDPGQRSCSVPPALTTAASVLQSLISDPSGLAGSSVGSQSLAKYVLGPTAQADIQTQPLKKLSGPVVMAGGDGPPEPGAKGSRQAPYSSSGVSSASRAGPLTFPSSTVGPSLEPPAAAPDGYGGSRVPLGKSSGCSGCGPCSKSPHGAVVAAGQCHLHCASPSHGRPAARSQWPVLLWMHRGSLKAARGGQRDRQCPQHTVHLGERRGGRHQVTGDVEAQIWPPASSLVPQLAGSYQRPSL